MLEYIGICNRDGGDDLAVKGILDVSVELEIGLGDEVVTVDLGDGWSGSRVGIHGMGRRLPPVDSSLPVAFSKQREATLI